MSAARQISARNTFDPGTARRPALHEREGVARFDQALELKSGRMLEQWRLAYRLVGDERLPLVLVMGGISAGRDFHRPDGSGWWQKQFGPGKAGDSEQFCFLAFDFLGGNGKSTGPANLDGDASRFPAIDSLDQARAAARLLDYLGVERLHSIIAASYGGMVALQFASGFPHRLAKALVLCAAHQASPLATGWRHVQREILALGIRHDDTANAVRIARSLAMCTYRAEPEFSRRFPPSGGGISPVTEYLDHCGARFSGRFNVYAYLCLSRSIDEHFVSPGSISVPIDLVGFSSDQIVSPAQLFDLKSRLGGECSLQIVDTAFGHDAFLVETAVVSRGIRRHLEGLS